MSDPSYNQIQEWAVSDPEKVRDIIRNHDSAGLVNIALECAAQGSSSLLGDILWAVDHPHVAVAEAAVNALGDLNYDPKFFVGIVQDAARPLNVRETAHNILYLWVTDVEYELGELHKVQEAEWNAKVAARRLSLEKEIDKELDKPLTDRPRGVPLADPREPEKGETT